MNKLLLTVSAVLALAVAACGPGGGGNRSPTTTGAPQITGPLTTGAPGSSQLPLESGDAMPSAEQMESPAY